MKQKSFSTHALVLKRVNTGEADRIVTLLTRDHGKIVCAAKGVRKMKSSKRAFLEPGNLINAYLVNTKSMPLLTQATLLDDHIHCKQNLVAMRQLTQILEVTDRLFTEDNSEPDQYDLALSMIYDLNHTVPNLGLIKQKLTKLVSEFGFMVLADGQGKSILDIVAEVTEKPMRSWEYLSVRN